MLKVSFKILEVWKGKGGGEERESSETVKVISMQTEIKISYAVTNTTFICSFWE